MSIVTGYEVTITTFDGCHSVNPAAALTELAATLAVP